MEKINITFCGQKQLCLSKADHKTLMNNLKTEFLKLFETYKEENIVFYFGGNDGLSAKAFAALSEMKHEFKFERIYVNFLPRSYKKNFGLVHNLLARLGTFQHISVRNGIYRLVRKKNIRNIYKPFVAAGLFRRQRRIICKSVCGFKRNEA